jgi:hypothetical protein
MKLCQLLNNWVIKSRRMRRMWHVLGGEKYSVLMEKPEGKRLL